MVAVSTTYAQIISGTQSFATNAEIIKGYLKQTLSILDSSSSSCSLSSSETEETLGSFRTALGQLDKYHQQIVRTVPELFKAAESYYDEELISLSLKAIQTEEIVTQCPGIYSLIGVIARNDGGRKRLLEGGVLKRLKFDMASHPEDASLQAWCGWPLRTIGQILLFSPTSQLSSPSLLFLLSLVLLFFLFLFLFLLLFLHFNIDFCNSSQPSTTKEYSQ
jgi:hypothetical protein